jgi:hypothetical protein
MNTIHMYDPGDGPQLPELPPLPIGPLMVGITDLLYQADDLPQPTYITVHADDQHADFQFPPGRDSLRAITRWVLRFGGVVISTPLDQGPEGTQTICHAEFDYYGIAVTVYAFIPVRPSGDPGPGAEQDTAHADYPHLPGRLADCPACQARCHCTPGDAECVYDGLHNGQADT